MSVFVVFVRVIFIKFLTTFVIFHLIFNLTFYKNLEMEYLFDHRKGGQHDATNKYPKVGSRDSCSTEIVSTKK